MNSPLTIDRFKELRLIQKKDQACEDYYLRGMTNADNLEEALDEVERLKCELGEGPDVMEALHKETLDLKAKLAAHEKAMWDSIKRGKCLCDKTQLCDLCYTLMPLRARLLEDVK